MRISTTIAALALLLAAAGCQTVPTTTSTALANTQIALTTAIQTSDNALGAACTDPASDACGKALAWHKAFRACAGLAATMLQGARASASTNPASAQTALERVNAIIQQLNAMIQTGGATQCQQPQS